jgi:hypothetical protein
LDSCCNFQVKLKEWRLSCMKMSFPLCVVWGRTYVFSFVCGKY